MTTRKYTQQVRAVAADETRRRILDAMRDRLRAAPSEALSIERVAQDAGVARSTVYVVFGSKAGLFEALGQDLLCLLYTSPSPRDLSTSRMPSSA